MPGPPPHRVLACLNLPIPHLGLAIPLDQLDPRVRCGGVLELRMEVCGKPVEQVDAAGESNACIDPLLEQVSCLVLQVEGIRPVHEPDIGVLDRLDEVLPDRPRVGPCPIHLMAELLGQPIQEGLHNGALPALLQGVRVRSIDHPGHLNAGKRLGAGHCAVDQAVVRQLLDRTITPVVERDVRGDRPQAVPSHGQYQYCKRVSLHEPLVSRPGCVLEAYARAQGQSSAIRGCLCREVPKGWDQGRQLSSTAGRGLQGCFWCARMVGSLCSPQLVPYGAMSKWGI